jgi:hypothetical protein
MPFIVWTQVVTKNLSRQFQKGRKPSIVSTTTSSSAANSPREVSSFDSALSSETNHSTHTIGLPALQSRTNLDDYDRLDPVMEDDPQSFDLVSPPTQDTRGFNLEKRAEELFSREHLQAIFDEPSSMLRFTSFLSRYRPKSIPLLIYYLDALKSLRAIKYANAIAEALSPIGGLEFTETCVQSTVNEALEKRTMEAFDRLVQEDLPAYICHVFMNVVTFSLRHRVTGTMPPDLREASEGLGEAFCLSDPSRPDCPIVLASEEFHRTTQYGVNYALGRNCRFLQGPNTSRAALDRIKGAIMEQKEICEVLVN